ncbi:DegT/DnrJ/EryC1/StrS family aminotransferase [Candidatus Uabimicrobium amorphum]|uniref:Pyridoxal phosphate-dependent aminotransferase n=1 Tax=Uabimicrobium amorphum TaxID=2596890 RepID=A0A5S9F4Q1_UABAM|nr:DegT/DnrJ/EryC1/StrS family aminotransferase [Candidatus Uabimicrobium amorphum]BBM84724.1 pyridoxal phosphate-dependent aminotransferase [Candidatus Uabimicrobium amorphum]
MTNKRIYLSPPHMDGRELEYIQQAFASNFIAPCGPMLNQLEKQFSEYSKIPYCVGLTSGTAALHLALKGLKVQPGDIVIASTLTFIGSVSSAAHMGTQLVFIDSSEDTWTMDPQLLEEEITRCKKNGKLPKAVIPTDLYGQSCDFDAISRICKPHGIPVVMDSAEAIGAKYKDHHVGYDATAAIYSLNGNKIITSSGGGILASHDKNLIDYARFLSTQAREPFPYYEHQEIGYNYRLSNISAAIACAQLEIIDKKVQQKRAIFTYYQQHLGDLPGITFMPQATYGQGNSWLSVILIDPEKFGGTYEDVRQKLEEHNIESRPMWKPMHLQPVFRHCRVVENGVANKLFSQGLCLPSGTSLTEDDLNRIINIVKNCGNSQ